MTLLLLYVLGLVLGTTTNPWFYALSFAATLIFALIETVAASQPEAEEDSSL